jgi:hypothetical protein
VPRPVPARGWGGVGVRSRPPLGQGAANAQGQGPSSSSGAVPRQLGYSPITFHVRMVLSALADAMMDWSGATETASTSSEWLALPRASGWMVWKQAPVLIRHSLMVLSGRARARRWAPRKETEVRSGSRCSGSGDKGSRDVQKHAWEAAPVRSSRCTPVRVCAARHPLAPVATRQVAGELHFSRPREHG